MTLRSRIIRTIGALSLAGAILGCGGGGSSKPAPLFTVSISPGQAGPLVPGQGQSFVGQASDGAILTWQVLEPNGGKVLTWAYSNSVSYSAPGIAGTYTLQATHPKDPNSAASVRIQVKASGGVWGAGNPMDTFRNGSSDNWYATSSPTLTALGDNRCLVAGGSEFYGPILASAVLVDFHAGDRLGLVTATGSMVQARTGHTATLLQDGRVLMVGGTASGGTILKSTELYDPKTGTFTAGPSMANPRVGHQATLLADGRVLFTGGLTPGAWNGKSNNNPMAQVEMFDPKANGGMGAFQTGGPLTKARYWHSATPLKDGRVLVAGGVDGPDSMINVTDSVEI